MATTRLAAFSDGVLAIAATLLILDVRATGAPLGHELLHIWPSYVACATSFTTIGIIWVNHHTVVDQISHVDRRFLFRGKIGFELRHDVLGHLALDRKYVGDVAVIGLRPQMPIRAGIDQLRIYSHLPSCALHAAFQYMCDA